MAGQTQKERRSSREGPSEVAPPERGSRERGRHLKDKIDELLDEIDGVLEEKPRSWFGTTCSAAGSESRPRPGQSRPGAQRGETPCSGMPSPS
jgi:hypothetical protein